MRGHLPTRLNQIGLCHTLKYLILECEYLLECVHPSLGFFENFPDSSGDYSLFP
jgi:hypothetical protein